MKKLTFAFMALATITMVGCKEKNDPQHEGATVIEGTKITALRSYTEKSPNPIKDTTNFKLDKSTETLRSLRHVSKNRLFYMDYLADFPMDQMWKTGSSRYAYDPEMKGEYNFLNDFLDLLFYTHPEPQVMDDPLTNTPHVLPFEFNCMENYYCNPIATATYITDPWQFGFSAKVRAGHMMNAYRPIMSEFEALKCLQEGTYTMEYPDNKTNYSAVYNPVQRTVKFNVHNDMSEAFTIDLKKDL